MPPSGGHRWRHVSLGSDRYECKNCGKEMEWDYSAHSWHGPPFERCEKAPAPWSNWRINKSFMQRLRNMFGLQPFTNRQAYEVYAMHHAEEWGSDVKGFGDPNAQYLQMNVRNHLCAAAYRDELVRLGPGHYCFAE